MIIDWILVTSMAVSAILAVVCLVHSRTIASLRRHLTTQQQAVRNLENDFNAICHAARRMGEDVVYLDKRLRNVGERQDNLDLRAPDLATYQQAISMVRRGAPIEELMETCQLGRSEAELVHLMHHHHDRQAQLHA